MKEEAMGAVACGSLNGYEPEVKDVINQLKQFYTLERETMTISNNGSYPTFSMEFNLYPLVNFSDKKFSKNLLLLDYRLPETKRGSDLFGFIDRGLIALNRAWSDYKKKKLKSFYIELGHATEAFQLLTCSGNALCVGVQRGMDLVLELQRTTTTVKNLDDLDHLGKIAHQLSKLILKYERVATQ